MAGGDVHLLPDHRLAEALYRRCGRGLVRRPVPSLVPSFASMAPVIEAMHWVSKSGAAQQPAINRKRAFQG